MAPPSKDDVMHGMKQLSKFIADQHNKHVTLKQGGDQALAKLRAPLTKLVGDNQDKIKKRIDDLKKAPKLAKPIPIIKPQPKSPLGPAGFEQFYQSPYQYIWTDTGGDSGVGSASTLDQYGNITVSASASNQHGYGAAGLGVLFNPPSDMAISIQPLITYNFNWLDLANFINASSSAFFAIRVQVFDSSGKFLANQDFNYPLWNDTAGWLDEHSNSGSGTIDTGPNIYVIGGYYYIIWFWFDVSCANGATTFSDGAIEAVLHYVNLYSPN
jgi:hypothetical protein